MREVIVKIEVALIYFFLNTKKIADLTLPARFCCSGTFQVQHVHH